MYKIKMSKEVAIHVLLTSSEIIFIQKGLDQRHQFLFNAHIHRSTMIFNLIYCKILKLILQEGQIKTVFTSFKNSFCSYENSKLISFIWTTCSL